MMLEFASTHARGRSHFSPRRTGRYLNELWTTWRLKLRKRLSAAGARVRDEAFLASLVDGKKARYQNAMVGGRNH